MKPVNAASTTSIPTPTMGLVSAAALGSNLLLALISDIGGIRT